MQPNTTPARRFRAAAAALLATVLVHATPVGLPDPRNPDAATMYATPVSADRPASRPPVSTQHQQAPHLRTVPPHRATIPGVEPDRRLTRPHVLQSPFADVLVHVRGSAVCSGTSLTGTTFIVTAAHCVLDHDGTITGSIRVLRRGAEYKPTSVLVDTRYRTSPSPSTDAAVLVMDQTIPGPSASLGRAFPIDATVTLAGYQPIDTDGSLLRGSRYDNTPTPHGFTGGVYHVTTAPAGCTLPASEGRITDTRVTLPCGLIPGASGGGVFVEHGHHLILVGVISTVDVQLTTNGLVPLAAVHQLLDNPVAFSHHPTVESRPERIACHLS